MTQDASQLADLVWAGGALVLVVLILLTRRARRHGGALRAGVVGAMYEWQNKDKQRALDVIVEGKAEARRPEYPDGNLPDLEAQMQMCPYLSFKGDCEAAFKFYEQCLGGRLGAIFRYAGSPLADQVPADWQDKIMHGSLTLGEQMLMGGDVAPDRYEEPKGFSLSLQIQSPAEAERVFRDLARDGRVVVPLEKTFWAERFGMVFDRFGIPWLVNCEAPIAEKR